MTTLALIAAAFYEYERVNYDHKIVKYSLLSVMLTMLGTLTCAMLAISDISKTKNTIDTKEKLFTNLEYIKECARESINYASRFDLIT